MHHTLDEVRAMISKDSFFVSFQQAHVYSREDCSWSLSVTQICMAANSDGHIHLPAIAHLPGITRLLATYPQVLLYTYLVLYRLYVLGNW